MADSEKMMVITPMGKADLPVDEYFAGVLDRLSAGEMAISKAGASETVVVRRRSPASGTKMLLHLTVSLRAIGAPR